MRGIFGRKEHSKKEDVYEFLREVRKKNPEKRIIIILNNFSSHKAKDTVHRAEDFEIDLYISTSIFSGYESDRIHLKEHQESYLTEIYR